MSVPPIDPAPIARPLGQRLMRGGAWALLGRVLALPTGIVLTMVLARLLEPEAVGSYFLAMSMIALLIGISQGGMARAMVRLVASALATARPRAVRHAIRLVLALTLLLGSALALAVADGPGVWAANSLRDGARLVTVLPLLAALLLGFALIDLIAEILRGFHDLPAASLLGDSLSQRLLLAAALLAVWLSGSAVGLAEVLGLSLAGTALVLLLALARLGRRVATLGHGGEAWRPAEILRLGPPFLLVRMNLWLMAGADLWILGLFRPADEVAIYGASSRLALLTGIPLVICNGVLAPIVAELFSQGQKMRLERLLRGVAAIATLPSLALVALFVLTGDRLLGAVFTEAYAAGHGMVAVLAFGQWLHVAFGSCAISLTMTGHQNEVVRGGLITAVFAVTAHAIAAPAFGGLGVAAVTALSLVLYNVLLAHAAYRRLGIRTWASYTPEVVGPVARELRRTLRPAG